MFIIRRAKVDDISTLLKLSKMVHFINLPPDKEIITQKIIHSRNSFLKATGSRHTLEPEPEPKLVTSVGEVELAGLGSATAQSDLFMFVMEDTESSAALGSSQVLAQMGGPSSPNVRFKLERREFFSTSLQTGTSHVIAKLDLDPSGPAEIGGLILQPSYRGHPMKLGRFLGLIRFHFVGLYRKLFADRMLAEMMAPISADGDNLLWDYLGRRFVPLSYDEADRFCQYSREFISALLPKEDIYLSLLPPAARAGVGEVGPETVPARKMLEKLGFKYNGYVDPFDGGPHLECDTDDIQIVKDTRWMKMGEPAPKRQCKDRAIVSLHQNDGDFFACETPYTVSGKTVRIPRENMEAIFAEPGAKIGFTPMHTGKKPATRRAKAAPSGRKRSTSGKTTKKKAKRS